MAANVSVLQSKALDERYRVLVDAFTDHAVLCSRSAGHVSSWNSGANRFKGYREAEILGEVRVHQGNDGRIHGHPAGPAPPSS